MAEENVFVSLGSNIGQRRENLKLARSNLNDNHSITAESSIIETEPVGVDTESLFLNQVIRIEVSKSGPEEFLTELLQLETEIGRDRSRAPDRVIDLDLLYWNGLVRQDDPVLPHPELLNRRFLLELLVEIAPNFIHPQRGTSQQELLKSLE